jgi:hypothetical protein
MTNPIVGPATRDSPQQADEAWPHSQSGSKHDSHGSAGNRHRATLKV